MFKAFYIHCNRRHYIKRRDQQQHKDLIDTLVTFLDINCVNYDLFGVGSYDTDCTSQLFYISSQIITKTNAFEMYQRCLFR